MMAATRPRLSAAAAAPASELRSLLTEASQAVDEDRKLDAVELLSQVLERDPQNRGALTSLTLLSLQLRMHNTALQYAAQLLSLPDADAGVFELVGSTFYELGRYEASAAALREAMRLNPESQQAMRLYAMALRALGRMEEASAFLAALLAVRRDDAELWLRYSQTRHFAGAGAQIKQLRKLLQRDRLSLRERAMLQFALSKMYQDGGDSLASFKACQAGNRLMCEHERTEVERLRGGLLIRLATRVIDVFQPEFVAAGCVRTRSDRGLTLVLGPPRAGKSLLEGALGAHPAIRGWGERDVIDEVLRKSGQGLLAAYPDSLRNLDAMAMDRLGTLLEAAWGEAPAPGVVTHLVTTPGNIIYAGMLMMLNPQTRLVICRREHFANALAIYLKYFEQPHPYAWDVDLIAEYILVYERLAAHWQALFPERVSVLSYEDLVADPDSCVRRMLEVHGLDWDAMCANDAARSVRPEVVGMAGSDEARVQVTAAFGCLTDAYQAQAPLFAHAFERARQRILAMLPDAH
ncbi:MAG: sulfotransferase [Gammaproteobacteria bacterium]|nr:sulfotransferase [Gammaproteobacteria bacterium]